MKNFKQELPIEKDMGRIIYNGVNFEKMTRVISKKAASKPVI